MNRISVIFILFCDFKCLATRARAHTHTHTQHTCRKRERLRRELPTTDVMDNAPWQQNRITGSVQVNILKVIKWKQKWLPTSTKLYIWTISVMNERMGMPACHLSSLFARSCCIRQRGERGEAEAVCQPAASGVINNLFNRLCWVVHMDA